ncbi:MULTISPECIES: MFS transporter [unclassified Streptomyces]|uniref:MFS transporter n=1 Tax=Streptomyces TaxID=1883 RepID=UPI0001C1D522|nr:MULTISPECIES: MFS transporter [unclassified Streptomyces]AEN10135.1 major facilitator superfamily MFS_1 [Streptomyces sp. SirexAA-E]MYR67009.1 MFS transporter [Streptomyces sp. SID4939]MYS02044.1 MFS transporter [Streptomyces sp. SID4940]MYT66083.1 MFS transporter [Streptomyces sp. SID8357]MYT88145.1 MFS transporter [Streptomyces sp. SID8360]
MKKEAGRVPFARRLAVPGGRDGRRMLVVAVIDKIGTGLWAGASTLYFIYVAHLSVAQIGTLMGVSGVLGVAGPPLAGRLADRFPVTRLLVVAQLARGAALLALLTSHEFLPLMLYSALGALPDRASSVLTKLFAARVAGPQRTRYQAVQRTAVNIGWAVGGGGAAAVLTVGTASAYQVLLLANVASYLVIAALTLRCAEPPSPSRVVAGRHVPADGPGSAASAGHAPGSSPWRDRRYLAFTGTEVWLFLDDSLLQVAFPLWIVHGTSAPVGLAPLVLVLNSVLVVALQVPLSRFAETPAAARRLLLPLSVAFLTGGAALAASAAGGPWFATGAVLVAAAAFTLAEILHSLASWELSVALAPGGAQGAYLGVHGLAQSAQRSLGPVVVGAAVGAGPLAWPVLGASLVAACLFQRRLVRPRERVGAPGPVLLTAPRSGRDGTP